MSLRREATALVVVDVQEAFRAPIPDFERIAQRTSALVRGARILGLPIVVTEQYPRGLGPTVPEVGLGDLAALPKTVFAASRADGFDLDGRSQVVVCGIEAHVCVHQTVADLRERDVDVHLCTDAIGSRDPADRDVAIRRAEEVGAKLTTTEMALFELCGAAGTPEFKQVQALIL